MKLPGQEEFEVSSACENVPTGELDSGPGSPLDTDSREQGVPKDPLPFIQLNELLGWPQALEWRETGSLQKLHSLMAKGLVLLDCPAQSLLELAGSARPREASHEEEAPLKEQGRGYHEMGRAVAILFSDPDVRRKASWYPRDFLDALRPQCFSAVLCIYLATVTNAITFGGRLGEATDSAQGVLESFLGTAVAGAAFFLMAGQPLTILSSTGPVLVFEHLLFSFSRDHSLDYLPFCLWVGIWVAPFCLVLVATEASVLVRYFTRFTEEGFCALISLIFIYDAVGKMLTLTRAYPIQRPGSPAYGCQYSDPGAALPALLLSILIFMDQQIAGVIPNCTEYRLQKGAGFQLDLLCVAVLMQLTSALGLPWCVSATVISLAHMDSLRRASRACAPGEAPSFLGIREQRPTGLAVFILTGISIFLAPFIPMPLLYGIFLYMGVTAISSIQFTKRVQLLLMPAKHQPDLLLLWHVPLRRVHFFTAIQLACLGLLWIVKSTPAAIIFPLMLLDLVGVRKALEWVFSPQELLWLDEPMPEKERSITEKGLEPEYSFSGSDNEDSAGNLERWGRTGRQLAKTSFTLLSREWRMAGDKQVCFVVGKVW
ncbi:Anion exchange protein 4, partial [Eschrichtius robustus]|nr:Anion exchange protein 4 [Eschrichtius robustus]